jgi:hypothetical protein
MKTTVDHRVVKNPNLILRYFFNSYDDEFRIERVDGFEESVLDLLVAGRMFEREMLVSVFVRLEKLHSQT